MAAPTNAANVKNALANSEPSTHGTDRRLRNVCVDGGHLAHRTRYAQCATFSGSRRHHRRLGAADTRTPWPREAAAPVKTGRSSLKQKSKKALTRGTLRKSR
jgi:hypothetical protein